MISHSWHSFFYVNFSKNSIIFIYTSLFNRSEMQKMTIFSLSYIIHCKYCIFCTNLTGIGRLSAAFRIERSLVKYYNSLLSFWNTVNRFTVNKNFKDFSVMLKSCISCKFSSRNINSRRVFIAPWSFNLRCPVASCLALLFFHTFLKTLLIYFDSIFSGNFLCKIKRETICIA